MIASTMFATEALTAVLALPVILILYSPESLSLGTVPVVKLPAFSVKLVPTPLNVPVVVPLIVALPNTVRAALPLLFGTSLIDSNVLPLACVQLKYSLPLSVVWNSNLLDPSPSPVL